MPRSDGYPDHLRPVHRSPSSAQHPGIGVDKKKNQTNLERSEPEAFKRMPEWKLMGTGSPWMEVLFGSWP